jgi:hypothetical protein
MQIRIGIARRALSALPCGEKLRIVRISCGRLVHEFSRKHRVTLAASGIPLFSQFATCDRYVFRGQDSGDWRFSTFPQRSSQQQAL